jgi:hypothetical protein
MSSGVGVALRAASSGGDWHDAWYLIQTGGRQQDPWAASEPASGTAWGWWSLAWCWNGGYRCSVDDACGLGCWRRWRGARTGARQDKAGGVTGAAWSSVFSMAARWETISDKWTPRGSRCREHDRRAPRKDFF